MKESDNTLNQLCRSFAQPLYWELDEQLQILSSDVTSCSNLTLNLTDEHDFPTYCITHGLEYPLQEINFSTKNVTIKNTIILRYNNRIEQFQCHAEFIENGSKLLLVAFNITNHMENENNKVKVSFLQNIIDHIPYHLFWKDENSTFLGCNKLFAETAELNNHEEIVGKTDYDLPWDKANSDAYRLDDQEVILSKTAKLDIEETMYVGDQELTLLTSKVPLIKDGRVIGVIGIFHDITARKKMITDLGEAKKTAENALRAKSNLLAIVSHELRTPLHGILGMTQMIRDQSDNSNVLVHTNDIKALALILLNLVNDLLDFTQFERKQLILNMQPFSIVSMINEVKKQIAQTMPPNPKIQFSCLTDPDIPDRVIGDELRIRQVLGNLLSNAFKFTIEGSIILNISTASRDKHSVSLIFSVKDTGCGISANDQKDIFKTFFQVKNTQQITARGIGLGLAICQEITEMMGTTIELTSDQENGSEFTFDIKFPLPNVDQQPIATIAKPKTYSTFNRHILLVEDDRINQKVMAYYLDLLSCTYDIAGTANEALAYLSSQTKYDLLFLDIGLPDMSGTELIKFIRQQDDRKNTPIVILTAQVLDRKNQKNIAEGSNAILIKPAEIDDIEHAITHNISE